VSEYASDGGIDLPDGMDFKGTTFDPTVPYTNLYAVHDEQVRLLGRVKSTGLGLIEGVFVGHAIKGWNEKKAHLSGGTKVQCIDPSLGILCNLQALTSFFLGL
jgi:hypothetical protein